MKANQRSFSPAQPKAILLSLILFGLLGGASRTAAGEAPYYRDLYADTWVGHDALGRNMPTYSVVGPVKKDHRRVVGIFYITWHSDSAHKGTGPYNGDVSRILADRSEGPAGCQTPALDGGHRTTGASRRRATS